MRGKSLKWETAALHKNGGAFCKLVVSDKLEPFDGAIDEAACLTALQRRFAKERPPFMSLPHDKARVAFAMIEQDGKTPIANGTKGRWIERETCPAQIAEHDAEIPPEKRWKEIGIMQTRPVIAKPPGEWFHEQQRSERAPKERHGGHPFGAGERFERTKLDQPAAAAIKSGAPKLVERDFSTMSVSRRVGMEMTQRFTHDAAMIAAWKLFEEAISHFQIEQ